MISEDGFDNEYNPLHQSKDGDLLAPSYRDAMAFTENNGLGERNIWAITESDEDDSLIANPGPAMVNVVGYLVTEKPWVSGDEVAMYFEDEGEELSQGPS